MVLIKFKKVHPNAVIPKYQTFGAAGFDLHAVEFTRLNSARGVTLVRTGLAVEIPKEITIRDLFSFKAELMLRPRSGLSTKGLMIVNSPGTIDSDYRGEIMVPMRLLPGDERTQPAKDMPWTHDIHPGDRIAQGVINIILTPWIIEAEELSSTARGAGGFGSTGV
jgi:dUTP pyrophosphatase